MMWTVTNSLLNPSFPGSASSSSYHIVADRTAPCGNESPTPQPGLGREFWTGNMGIQELLPANWFEFWLSLFICLLVCLLAM